MKKIGKGSMGYAVSNKTKSLAVNVFDFANVTSTSFTDISACIQEFAKQGFSLDKACEATVTTLTIYKLLNSR